ncbi:MAG: DUF3300 domain-containing protein [Burkholderiales bacterium]
MTRLFHRAARLVLALLFAVPLAAAAQNAPTFSSEQLDQMMAPIALYPDALLSQVLMASTYPADVAEAVKWAKANQSIKGDAAVKAVQDQPWDPSVQSLVAFPQVLAIMGEKPEWVQNVGDAFLAQPNAVMDSVQRLRQKAQAAGNLKTNEQVKVSTEATPPLTEPLPAGAPPPPPQVIVIQPANPQVIYVPTYNPTVVFGPWWYPAYPPVYIPPPPGWGFVAGAVSAGIAWGVAAGVSNALWGGMNWGRGDVNINVNRYNNINVNNRINSNNNNINWQHNANNRGGVPYRDQNSRNQYQRPIGNPDNRQDMRGRDAQRQQAEAALSNRVGADNMNRQALQNVDRSTLQNRGGGGQFGGGARDNAGGGAGAANRGMSYNQLQQDARGRTGNVDNAFRGAGDGAATRQQIDRGAQSRQAMQQRPQQANRPEQRPQPQMNRPAERPQPQMNRGGGGGGERPQMNRGGGGGGGGARPGGGGGRGR